MLDSDLCETMGNDTHFSSHFTLLLHPPTSCRETCACPELMHGIQGNKNGGGDKQKRESSSPPLWTRMRWRGQIRQKDTQRHLTHGHYGRGIIWEKWHTFGGYIEEWLKKGVGVVGKIKTNTKRIHTLWPGDPQVLSYNIKFKAGDGCRRQGTMPRLHPLHLDKYHLGVRGRKVSPPTDSKIGNKMPGAVTKVATTLRGNGASQRGIWWMLWEGKSRQTDAFATKNVHGDLCRRQTHSWEDTHSVFLGTQQLCHLLLVLLTSQMTRHFP